MKSDSLIFPKPTVEEVYERITPFVEDTHFEASMEAEIDARKRSYYALRSHLDAQNPDYDAILETIGENPEVLGTIISMLGLSQEEFYRYVTLIRVAQGEAFTSEWKLQTIARQMKADVQLGRHVLQLLFYGKKGHPLSDKLPVSARIDYPQTNA